MSELRPYPKPSYPQRIKTAVHYLLPQLAVTRAAGWLADRRWGVLTTLAVKTFAACYKIDLAEAEKSRAGDYASFNEFFIRTLKPGARPIDANPDTLCLPADGRVSEAGAIENGRLIQAKGHSFTTLELLAGDETLAAGNDPADGLAVRPAEVRDPVLGHDLLGLLHFPEFRGLWAGSVHRGGAGRCRRNEACVKLTTIRSFVPGGVSDSATPELRNPAICS